jgi:hypothetical protein
MRKLSTVHVTLALALLASSASAGGPPSGGPRVGDRLAAYTPTKNIGARGKVKCETC